MKLIIAGTRTFTNYQKLKQACDHFLQDQNNIEIVSGAYYRGADKLGEQYAKERGYKLTQFPADWDTFGRAAGPKRNQQMANYADALIVFWDGKSRGAKHMIELAKRNHLKVQVCNY
ncbi:SLOG family protein [Lutibacter holmesii]|uniref:SLOG family protein n=1 Tax=Lutibacter holmesii TaxID=1137985 RepID=A0ABW3WL38_9FLAO